MRFRVVLGPFFLISLFAIQVNAQSAPQFARDHVYGPGGRVAVTIEPDNYPPIGPFSLSAVPGNCVSDGVDLSWDTATDIGSGVYGYNVYRDGGSIGSTSADSYHDTPPHGDTSYTYAVAAVDNAGHEGEQASTSAYVTLCTGRLLKFFRVPAVRQGLFARIVLHQSPFGGPVSLEDDRPRIRYRAANATFLTVRDYSVDAVRPKSTSLAPPTRQYRVVAGGGL